MSSFQSTLGTLQSVLNIEVSSIQGSRIEGLHNYIILCHHCTFYQLVGSCAPIRDLLASRLLWPHRLGEKLGSGQFGEVCKSQWKFSGTSLEAAAKTLKIHAPEEEKVRFLREAAIMGQFCHPNVVRLYGMVTMREPVSPVNTTYIHTYIHVCTCTYSHL